MFITLNQNGAKVRAEFPIPKIAANSMRGENPLTANLVAVGILVSKKLINLRKPQ